MAVANLPGILDAPSDIDGDNPSVTWLGHGVGAAYGFGFLLLMIIYIAKRWLHPFALSVPTTILWYLLGIACSLPYIWFLVVLDWQNEFVNRIFCWVYVPIMIWAIPTVTFLWDLMRRTPLVKEAYLLRSLFEISVIVPTWVWAWTFFSFFFLGGGWI